MDKKQDPFSMGICPVCGFSSLFKMLHIDQIPVLCHSIWENRDDALMVERADISLVTCLQCGHVYNQEFEPLKVQYSRGYENSLHYSPHFQKYSRELARYLINRYGIRKKSILEIGSGSGYFLRLLCDYGDNTGIGFDPGYEPEPDEECQSVTLIRDQFRNQFPPESFDLIIARHTLEHLFKPSDLIHALRTTNGGNKRKLVYVEVPNFDYIFRKTAIWDIIYEHYSYFSRVSLERLFTLNGFQVLNLSEKYEGQYLSVEAISGSRGQGDQKRSPPAHEELESMGTQFTTGARKKIHWWKSWLSRTQSSGKKVVIWGAGSKGVNFLNILAIRDEIEYVVDVNPKKQYTYVAGTGQQIVPPGFLKEYRPDWLIIMNLIYQNEIRASVNQLDIKPDIIYV